jgi:hypothetical protein
VVRSLRLLVECKQEEGESINSYLKRSKNSADLVEAQCDGTPILLRKYAKSQKVKEEEAYSRLLAYFFVENSSGRKSGELLNILDNDYAAAPKGKGDNMIPKTLTEAVTRVTTYKPMVAEISKGDQSKISKFGSHGDSEKTVALHSQGRAVRAVKVKLNASDVERKVTSLATVARLCQMRVVHQRSILTVTRKMSLLMSSRLRKKRPNS